MREGRERRLFPRREGRGIGRRTKLLTEAQPWRVACLGILVADMVARPVAEVPPPGELRLTGEMGLYVGGCAANTASGLARLGIPVGVLGKVGADPLGEFLRRALDADGVDTRALIVSPASATSATMALVGPSGERAFLHAFGGNGDLVAEEIDLGVCGAAAILHVGGVGLLPSLDGAPLARVCQAAKARGMIVTLDTAWDPLGRWTGALAALPYVDYFLPSREEAAHIFGVSAPEAIVRAAQQAGARAVIVKLGAEGCYVDAGGAPLRLPALEGPVVDTTGAGDAFCAGFLAGLAQGWDPEASARLGTATGCLAVSRMGAVSGIQSLEQALEVYRRGGLRESE